MLQLDTNFSLLDSKQDFKSENKDGNFSFFP